MSCAREQLSIEGFQNIVKYLISFINKDKQV